MYKPHKGWYELLNPQKFQRPIEILSKKAIDRFKDKTNHPMYGRTHSEEAKDKNRQAQLGRTHSEITKLKMSAGRKTSETIKLKISKANKGKKRSDKIKLKFSEIQKNLPKIKCPHCPMIGSQSNMKRWHFNNCKFKNV